LAETPSKDESKNSVVEDFNIMVRRTTLVDGTKKCEIRDITIIDPYKDQAPVVPPEKENPVAAVTPTAVEAPRELIPDDEDRCGLCEIVEDALKEKAKAAKASRRLPSWAGRRKIAKS